MTPPDPTEQDLHAIRSVSADAPLQEAQAGDDPFALFQTWLDQALEANDGAWFEPNAMALSTADAQGRPDCRIVLLKHLDRDGLVFYTNLESAKAQQLAANPRAAAVFYWSGQERQVRVRGRVERVDEQDAREYFASRPRGSQLGALVSRQSRPLDSRQALEADLEQARARYTDKPIPKPDYWGGLRIVPEAFEFWQGRDNRLHDRLLYRRDGQGWARQRLSP
jgi:pyridoxamine 5'-phosphate oxidase